MDYDGYERRPPQTPNPLSREDQKRITAERDHAEQQRQLREQQALVFLQNSPAFSQMVTAADLYHELDKEGVAVAAAKEIAAKFTANNIDVKQLAQVVHDTIDRVSQEQKQTHHHYTSASQQPERSTEPVFPSRPGPTGQRLGKYAELEELLNPTARNHPAERGAHQREAVSASQLTQTARPVVSTEPEPRKQWPGKYAKLDKLLGPSTHDGETERIARQQREESDKRQNFTPARSEERQPTE